jgi:phosphate uptake regulator
MVIEFFRSRGESEFDAIEDQIGEMLATTHETFGMAMDALLRRVDPATIEKPIRKADKSVNKVERAIRRTLVVHAGVHQAQMDIPLLLIYMSISKDIERIGDITKDMWDLAAAGVDLREAPDEIDIEGHANALAGLITETARIFADRDAEAATRFLNQTDEINAQYEQLMLDQLTAEVDASKAASRALLYRYINRITAHLMNVLTAVVMPVDRLDYWDEDKMDRD